MNKLPRYWGEESGIYSKEADVSALEAENERVLKPIDVLLFCPSCKGQHVDAPEPENDWTNPPHRKHLCHVCGNIWKAAEVPTNGVAILNREQEKQP